MKITATFIDEISHDIPHQNWGLEEWKRDFQFMKLMGINTVVIIRCGYQEWLTYPSEYLIEHYKCIAPSEDLIQLFLDLAEENEMQLFFGLYDSGKYWWQEGDANTEIDINIHVIDEVWNRYGHHRAFRGWYLSQEVSRESEGAILQYQQLGAHCKQISNGLPILISPYIDGKKAVMAAESGIDKENAISIADHEIEWGNMLAAIQDAVDIVAFQDGHVAYHELEAYLRINKKLADQYGLTSWTNVESFDRDMPIKFLPIKWDKLKFKLETADKVGIQNAITFEFSHFMSPQSAYLQAGHLYNRYNEWLQKQA